MLPEKTIEVSALASPPLKPHDFAQMIGAEKVRITDIDRFAPHDALYCRFDKVSYLFEILDIAKLIQDEIPLMTGFIDWKDDTQAKLLTQFGLRINRDLRKFYGLAVNEVAVVIEDPYLLEGADLALVFRLSNKGLFAGQVKKYRDEFLKSIPGAKEGAVRHRNINIVTLTSPDNRLSSYGFFDGDFAVIASSEWMAKKIIDVRAGTVKSAADNLDFQYLMKIHRGPGNAFIYIGDDFVGRMISAPFKIAELRRVNCEANLKILKYARNLYRIETPGKEPSINDLMTGGYISRAPVCPFDGNYELKSGSEPLCSRHGPLGYLNRLSSNEVTKVTAPEAELYRGFVSNYQNYWRRYVDPVGIRIDLGNTVSLRTVILPLIEHPDYRMIQDIFGGSPIELESLSIGNSAAIFHAAVKLKAFDQYKSDLSHISDAGLREKIRREREDFIERNENFKGDPLAWIGNEADLFMLDDAIPLNKDSISSGHLDDDTLLNLAVVRIKVRDSALARRAIPAFMKFFIYGAGICSHEKKYGGELWRTNVSRYISKMPLNILLRDDSLWLAFQERHFETMARSTSSMGNLFKSGDNKVVSLKDETGIKLNRGNFEVGIHPQNLHKMKKLLNLLTHLYYGKYCENNIKHLKQLVDLHEPFAWSKGTVDVNFLSKYKTGYSIRCPMNGTYQYTGDSAVCSFHNKKESDDENVQYEKLMNLETNLLKILCRLKNIVIDLGFTKEGLDTQVYIRNPLR